jgi:SWI/SNF-related matrix-associated actin-dependent regulator of chromatin subfamily A-like protein 1
MMEYKGSTNEKEVHEILKHHMIRRLKKEVLKDLPDKIRTKIKVEIDPKVQKEIDKIKGEM